MQTQLNISQIKRTLLYGFSPIRLARSKAFDDVWLVTVCGHGPSCPRSREMLTGQCLQRPFWQQATNIQNVIHSFWSKCGFFFHGTRFLVLYSFFSHIMYFHNCFWSQSNSHLLLKHQTSKNNIKWKSPAISPSNSLMYIFRIFSQGIL